MDISLIGTSVSISLINASAKKINIIGSVKAPGTYLVNPFTTVLSALAYSGGFEENASLRNITVIRGDEVINFDLYDFLIFGKRTNDITLQQGDTILVTSTNNFVKISGEVLRPYVYEYKPSDTYKDLIYDYRGIKTKAPFNTSGWNSVYVAGKIIEKIGPILAINNEEFTDLYVAEKFN